MEKRFADAYLVAWLRIDKREIFQSQKYPIRTFEQPDLLESPPVN